MFILPCVLLSIKSFGLVLLFCVDSKESSFYGEVLVGRGFEPGWFLPTNCIFYEADIVFPAVYQATKTIQSQSQEL